MKWYYGVYMEKIKIIGILLILIGILIFAGVIKPLGIISLGGAGDFTPILKGSISTLSPMEAGTEADVNFAITPVNIEQTNTANFYLKQECTKITLNKNGVRTPLTVSSGSGIKQIQFTHAELTAEISKTAGISKIKIPITQEQGDYVLEFSALGGEIRSILPNSISGVNAGGYYTAITSEDVSSIKLTLDDASKPITLSDFNAAQGTYIAQGYNSVEEVNAGKVCRNNQNIFIEIPIVVSAPSGSTILAQAQEIINSEDKAGLISSILPTNLIQNIQETTAKLTDPLKDKINTIITTPSGENKAVKGNSTSPLLPLFLIGVGAVMVMKS